MFISRSLIAMLAVAGTAESFEFSDVTSAASTMSRSVGDAASNLFTRQDSCAVWKDISTTLTQQFLADGQCTDAARAAIRAAFHDCFNGACDGSLILANECSNSENVGLERLCGNLGSLATQKNVGVADLIQFAAGTCNAPITHRQELMYPAAHAIKTCPGGPTVPVKIGRKDSSTASPTGILPTANDKGSALVGLFASKGFSAVDLAALVGAHTAAKQRTTDPSKAGAALDSTVGQWDNKFYSDTLNGKAPFTLQSDKNIASNVLTAIPFKSFAASQAAWSVAFVPAMKKLSLMGVQGVKLTDCTSALPGGSTKRDLKSGSIFERLAW